jgi:hypothetical protein
MCSAIGAKIGSRDEAPGSDLKLKVGLLDGGDSPYSIDCFRTSENTCPRFTITMTFDTNEPIHQDRLWSDGHWTARVIKNEDDDGWAVAMHLDGATEPALVGPWTMGRDKKNPKPLDTAAFNTLVKTAREVIRRSEQQLHAQLNKNVTLTVDGQRLRVALAIVPDEEGATATLSAVNDFDEELARVPAPPTFKLNVDSAQAWIASGFARPR